MIFFGFFLCKRYLSLFRFVHFLVSRIFSALFGCRENSFLRILHTLYDLIAQYIFVCNLRFLKVRTAIIKK